MYRNMNDKFYFNNPININEITMVSAFYDIGRDNWNNSKRSAEYYIDSFNSFLYSANSKLKFDLVMIVISMF